jgi:hypothetical protein
MKHSMKSIFAATFYLAVFICGITGILLLLDWDTHAYSACQLDLPPGQVTMAVDVNEYKACDQLPGFTGYFDATLSNVPSGYSLGNGTYAGFCADLGGYILDNPLFGNVTYQIQLLSSIEWPAFKARPWDKINYILTHYPIPGNSWLDVQAAVWTLIDGCAPQTDPTLFDCQPHRTDYFPFGASSPYGCPPNGLVDKVKVGQIIADANANGSGFIPGNGNRFAVIIDPQSCTGSNSGYNSYCSDPNHTPFQLLFTTTTCVANYTITASAGAGGGISPSGAVTVTHGANPSFAITPDANYRVSDVLVDGSSVGAVTSYPFTNVTANHTISASFVAVEPLSITTSSLPAGTVLTPYSQTLTATGGVLPYAWSVNGGSLPTGLTINSATGAISGTPTASGTFSFTAQVTDATLSSYARNLSIATEALPVRYGDPGGGPINYDQIIQSAYDHCIDGYIIQVQAMEFPYNDIFFDRPVTITLQGGFNEGFTNNASFTTIQGRLVINNGTVIVENIVVR